MKQDQSAGWPSHRMSPKLKSRILRLPTQQALREEAENQNLKQGEFILKVRILEASNVSGEPLHMCITYVSAQQLACTGILDKGLVKLHHCQVCQY